jgi:predicted Rossmann fold nucleotide-binding protein DprA/Smf involved in DNA uptake
MRWQWPLRDEDYPCRDRYWDVTGVRKMTDREAARIRTQMLKQLRETHNETVERTRERLKAQKAIRAQICKVLRAAPKTVPELAEATGLPAGEVLWHLTAMKKYDLAREVAPCGAYFLYEVIKDTEP